MQANSGKVYSRVVNTRHEAVVLKRGTKIAMLESLAPCDVFSVSEPNGNTMSEKTKESLHLVIPIHVEHSLNFKVSNSTNSCYSTMMFLH